MQNILRNNFANYKIKMTKKERLEEIIRYYSDSKPSVFAKYIGVAPSTISTWLARNTLDYDLIFAKCENINAEWLLSGCGNMLKDDSIPNEKILPPTNIENKLFSIIEDKDNIIREQAEEIGQLRERISQLQREKGKTASDARTSDIANAG